MVIPTVVSSWENGSPGPCMLLRTPVSLKGVGPPSRGMGPAGTCPQEVAQGRGAGPLGVAALGKSSLRGAWHTSTAAQDALRPLRCVRRVEGKRPQLHAGKAFSRSESDQAASAEGAPRPWR